MARALERVRQAASAKTTAEQEYIAALVAAAAAKHTRRAIAEAAGISHQRVHQIISEHTRTEG